MPLELVFAVFLFLDERHEVADRLLHDARRFDDLRQEHLAGTEQVADDVHARHERTLDHIERPRRRLPRFFGVLDDKFVNAVDERVLRRFVHRLRATTGPHLLAATPLFWSLYAPRPSAASRSRPAGG